MRWEESGQYYTRTYAFDISVNNLVFMEINHACSDLLDLPINQLLEGNSYDILRH